MSKLQLWRELKLSGNPDGFQYRFRGQLTREYVDNVNNDNRTLIWDPNTNTMNLEFEPPQLRSITYNADLFWGERRAKASRTIRVDPDATDDEIEQLIDDDLSTFLDDYGQAPDRYEIKYNETKVADEDIEELDLELGNVIYEHYNTKVNKLQQSKNCVLHAVRESFNRSRGYRIPTFPEILSVVDREFKKDENNKLTPWEMEQICQEYKLNLLIVGIDNKVIINYIDPSTKFGSNHGSLMCIASQGHCYTIDPKYKKSFASSKRAKMHRPTKTKQKQIKIVSSLREGLEHKGISLIDKQIHIDDVLELMHEEKKLFSLDVQRGNYLSSIKYRDSILKFNPHPQACIDIARREKIPFNGQHLASLANSMIKGLTGSSLSVNARDIFLNRNNSAINFCNGETFDKAFDISKCYTSCLRDINNYPIYTVFDDPEPWDGKYRNGFYYVETENTFPLSGNGWYYSELVQYCLTQNIQMKILYQLIPQYTQPNPFRDDIKKIYKRYPAHAKDIINYYIGYLNSRAKDSERMIITSSFQELLCYSRDSAFNINRDKGLYYLNYTQKATHKSKTPIPVYASIIDKAKIKIHQLAMKVGGELVAVKTDCIYVKGGYKTPKLSKHIGGYRIDNSPLPAMHCRMPYKGIYKLPDYPEWEPVDSIQPSCCTNGAAGTGKSTLIKNEVPPGYTRLAFTNTAARNIQGKTFHAHHNLFDEDSEPIMKDDSLVLDEYSMLPEDIYAHLLTKRSLFPESKIILVGDDRQIQFIPKGLKKNKDFPRVSDTDTFKRICNYKKLELTECKRASDKFFNLCLAGEYNKLEDKTMRHQLTNIVRTNLLRGKLNRQINKQFARGKTALLTIDDWNFNREGDSQTQVKGKLEIVEGSRWISREANKKLNIIKNDFYDIKDGNFVNQDGNIVPLSYYKNFCLRWAMTVNKCQGMTINDKFSIWESDMMDKYALYTAVSRATRIKQFRFR